VIGTYHSLALPDVLFAFLVECLQSRYVVRLSDVVPLLQLLQHPLEHRLDRIISLLVRSDLESAIQSP
jgi:hypothetical protein